MKGLELSRHFYEKFGEPMIHEQFSKLEPYIAVGLVGEGSECFGYDDSISELETPLEFLITTDNTPAMVKTKFDMIEDIAGIIINYLKEQQLTDVNSFELEAHAYSINEKIKDINLRNGHVMAVEKEWCCYEK